MSIATAVLHHSDLRSKLALKLLKLQYGEVAFKKLSKTKTEVSSIHYKSVQNIIMKYLGTSDADVADSIIYMKK